MAESSEKPLVSVAAGALSGAFEAGGRIAVFKGIPYARPPVGPLRWQPPQPLPPWPGTREAVASGPRAMQMAAGFKEFMANLVESQGMGTLKTALVKALFSVIPRPPQSEDCLTLDIRCPRLAPGVKSPVMVWFHGGDHQDGSGSDRYYASNALAQRGVVFVSVNYRLGLMGFFAHPQLGAESEHGVSGNYGTLDQVAALRWVQQNIDQFGGDPGNVTIFGQSAGGESVAHMMTSPLAKGLFHKAIMQSAGNRAQMMHLKHPFLNHPATEQAGERFAARFVSPGEDPLQALRQIPAPELYRVLREDPLAYRFYPTIDGTVLEKSPFLAFQEGQQADVPLLLGSNADEGTVLYPVDGVPLIGLAERELPAGRIAGVIRQEFGAEADKLFQLYPGLAEGASAATTALFTDTIFGSTAHFYALQASRRKQPVYLYLFTRTPPSPRQTAGAFHAAELSFVHGSRLPLFPTTAADHLLSQVMGDYWVQFAKTGDPNLPPHPQWPPFHPAGQQWMRLGTGDQLAAAPVDKRAAYAILQKRLHHQIHQMKLLGPVRDTASAAAVPGE